MQSSRSESVSPRTQRVQSLSATDTRGKHRIQAELKRLEQEARFLEEIKEVAVVKIFGFSEDMQVKPEEEENSSFYSSFSLELPSTSIKLKESSIEITSFHKHAAGSSALEELEQLEKMEKASSASKEMLNNVETRPDPLLSVTNGPINPLWDRWFEGPKDSKGCRCWIL